jgi:hypothetical protein
MHEQTLALPQGGDGHPRVDIVRSSILACQDVSTRMEMAPDDLTLERKNQKIGSNEVG